MRPIRTIDPVAQRQLDTLRQRYPNSAHLGAYWKGYHAGAESLRGIVRSCPYIDYRKKDGRLTFSRSFRRAWFAGLDDAMKDAKLLAAAPELLEACKALVALETPTKPGQKCCYCNSIHCDIPRCPVALAGIAIAKAGGGA